MPDMLDPIALANAQLWLDSPLSPDDKATILSWRESNPSLFNEAFYRDLEFGTGGLRGIMRLGSNGINKYTLGLATQGLATYLKQEIDHRPSVAIAYDSRNNSQSFAQEVARVLLANDVDVYLFDALRPTPQLSFAVRALNASAGIVLTASHNPKEYNGYKVYWNDGGQLVPPHDKALLTTVRATALTDIRWSGGSGKLHPLGVDMDEQYWKALESLTFGSDGKKELRIVFTSLHGTSITLVPEAFKRSGFASVSIVAEQALPDGNFPTVVSPNPEEPAALAMAIAQAESEGADLVIGCDPDTDRVGIAVRDNKGQLILLNGNETASVLMDYILHQRKIQGTLPKNAFVARTIVTTPLLDAIASSYGVEMQVCLTGFKWIADLIRRQEGVKSYLFGGEESYGYLTGDFVRDKDAVSSSVLIAEAAAWNLAQGRSFYGHLQELYKRHGMYRERLVSLTKEGRAGAEEIQATMDRYRQIPAKQWAGIPVFSISDYQSQSRTNSDGTVESLDLPASNVVQWHMANGDLITARPSGTEPKIKYYFCAVGDGGEERLEQYPKEILSL